VAGSIDPHNWYALFVKTGEEDRVKERLNYRFKEELTILVPKRRLRERRAGNWYFRTRTLFPGYVLVNGHIDMYSLERFKNVPGLFRLLRSGSEPLRIEPCEMEVLSRLICNGENIGFSQVLMENGRVRVVDGPLVSLEGHIISIDRRKGRAKVSLNFLGEPRTVELGVSVLRPED